MKFPKSSLLFNTTNLSEIQILLSIGCYIDSRDEDDYPVLLFAQTYDKIELLFKRGANLDLQGPHLETPLFEATLLKDDKIAETLIEYGAKVDIENEDGDTPFSNAVEVNKIHLCQLLLENGADINHQNKNGNSALMLVYSSDEMIKFLIENKINVNLRDKKGRTAINTRFFHNIPSNLFLLLPIVDLDIQDNEGYSPLMNCVSRGSIVMFDTIMKYKININLQNEKGDTALMIAISDGKNHMAKKLIEKGADVNLENKEGKSALRIAVESMNREIRDLLLKKY